MLLMMPLLPVDKRLILNRLMMMRFEEAAAQFPANWQAQLSEMYQHGGWDVEARAEIALWLGHCTQPQWEQWQNESLDFATFINTCRLLSRAWWERQGRERLHDAKFKYAGWQMVMKNRFGWGDVEVKREEVPLFKVVIEDSGSVTEQ